MKAVSHSLIALAETLELRWKAYRESGLFDHFVEFTLSLNGLTERLSQANLPGMASASSELEHAALALFGDSEAHPVGLGQAAQIERQLNTIVELLHRHETPAVITKRMDDHEVPVRATGRPRTVLVGSRPEHPWAAALSEQLSFFGFTPVACDIGQPVELADPPLAAVFIPDREGAPYPEEMTLWIRALRDRYVSTYFYCLSVPSSLESIVLLQRAGANVCVPAGNKLSDVLSRILDLVQAREQEIHRVLIVEDSQTAVAHIRRSLDMHGIESRAIGDPRILLEAVAEYQPHAILMDMHMPFCTGVEVTRALRQIPEYQSVPVIYLSGETDIALQVEALRLGGDQFLTKPANPVVLAAVVKNKIERYREMMRSGLHDSLTGLLNHSASKAQLDRMLRAALPAGRLAVAMVDIDRFKSINDNYGHPVGDQVIRSMAWLLRGRLRSSDLIGRYGGEEFILALSGVDIEQAQRMLERIRQDFSELPHAHANGSIRATFSCGLAAVPDYLTSGTLVEAADQALMQAKRGGRNQIVMARAK